MTGHRRIPWKTKPHVFTSCFNRVNYGLLSWKKHLIVIPSLWSDDMDIETIEAFGNSHLGGTDQTSSSFWPAEALVKHWC